MVETQYATDLTLSGLRRLCTVPTEAEVRRWSGGGQDYALHVGLYSYCAGIERLCKVALASHTFALEGHFPQLKKYSHRISVLLDAVADLDLAAIGRDGWHNSYGTRPNDSLDPALTDVLDRFAGGAGRYEHLDSLWDSSAEVSTLGDWATLCAMSSVPEEIARLMSIRSAMYEAVSSELIDAGLETSGYQVVEELGSPMFAPSVGVVLSLFRKVRWVCAILGAATANTSEGLPYLDDVVAQVFLHTAEDFFAFHLARIEDAEVVIEELEEVLPRVRAREESESDSDVGDL